MNVRSIILLGLSSYLVVSQPAAAQLRRSIRIVGSSTVFPFSTAVAERFSRTNPGVPAPVIESTGTGAGMKLFCAGVGAGHPDIEDASRRIKASEYKACVANGVSQITEIQVGLDGISLATAKATQVTGLTTREFYLAVAKTPFGKPNTNKTWRDINSRLPATPITIFGPPTTSGTRDAMVDQFMVPACESSPAIAALKKIDEARYNLICKAVREDGGYVEAGENDNLIVQKLIANPGTMGVFGYSYLEENGDRLKGVAINGVTPTYESIASFKYPGARPLFIYVKNAHLKVIPGIRQFVAEYARDTTWGPDGYLRERGMIAAPADVRTHYAKIAKDMTPLNGGELK